MSLFPALLSVLRALFRPRLALAAENLALRQQLAILHRTTKRPKLRPQNRLFWTILSRLWKGWRSPLLIVQPETVVKWHGQGFQLFWRWKSKLSHPGRPKVRLEIRDLIRRMSSENPLWGTPRIQAELGLLGFNVALVHSRQIPDQRINTSLADLENLPPQSCQAACRHRLFHLPTVTFRNLYCFIILSHDRRKVVHFNVTGHLTAVWTAQQIVEAFPEDTAPRFLLRDRDQIYGEEFRHRVKGMQIEEVITAPQSPWQNAYAERLIGSVGRECLDHVIVLSEEHLRRILKSYFRYYNEWRRHE